MQDIRLKLEASRKELLDLGLRNPLLNYKPSIARGVSIIDESAASVYDILVQQGKAMTFKATPNQKQNNTADVTIETTANNQLETYSDTKLQTVEVEEKLQQKLLNTYYTARTSIEEQGVNILYLAIGFLHWFENDTTAEARKAPLILIPVALERLTARERFRLRYTGEEVGENLSLQAKLNAEFHVALPDLPEEDVIGVKAYFQKVEEAVSHHQRWQVDENSIELGFFSFGKFMIYNDLDVEQWPEESGPMQHAVLQSLLGSGFRDAPPTTPEDAFLDDETDADRLFQVVDADSSQLLAMLAVHEGRSLVIQGPPGTGKSQTITNIIANAIGHGKKVLFVAEKMAALEVVKRRLDAIHLGEACLELHSHKGSKKELHKELQRVLELGKPALQHLQQQVSLLGAQREELNAYSKAVNTPIAISGLTPHQVMGWLLQLEKSNAGIDLPSININDIHNWDAEKAMAAEAYSNRVQALLKNIKIPSELLFWGSELKVMLPNNLQILQSNLQAALAATNDLELVATDIAKVMQLPLPQNRDETLRMAPIVELAAKQPLLKGVDVFSEEWLTHQKEIQTFLSAGAKHHELHQTYDSLFLPEVWEADVMPIRAELISHGDKWYKFLNPSYNKAVKSFKSFLVSTVPDNNAERLGYIDAILEEKRLKILLKENSTLAKKLFGNVSDSENWELKTGVAQFLQEVHQGIADKKIARTFLNYLIENGDAAGAAQYHALLLQKLQIQGSTIQSVVADLQLNESLLFSGGTLLHQSFRQQQNLLQNWFQNTEEVHHIIAWNNLKDSANDQNLNAAMDLAATWPLAESHLTTALKKTWYNYLLQKAFNESAALRKFERAGHEEVANQFAKLDVLNLQYNRARAALHHWEKVPKGESGGQVNLLRTEFNKKARHLPIRKLMKEAGLAIQAIKPVFMMSPLSIANFLPPGALEFDLVVFDEASQVRPVEAFGALLRGKQLVVVGDAKQLPPTSFFDTITVDVDDEENVTADLPSILSMCDAQGAPQRMLRWHYRSRHQSLITLSNHHFYDNKLVVFPSPGSGHKKGLFFHYLKETAYDRGGKRTNEKEAEAVALAVLEHAKLHPKLSLGVVAFSSAQRQAIQDALEIKRKENSAYEPFFNTANAEPFFVKNLENVQGDERDVIFISIGYGRTAEGYIRMNFGPLNNEGGEKRLNVLITRARLRCEVFTNITAYDIDINKTASAGVKVLKSFLQYAQKGQLDVPLISGKPADSPFEEAVAQELTTAGYQVHRQVGSKGFYIDLAIEDPEHPGRYILGIECDGAAYHSARSARDRDRLRQQVLEANGWKIYRIWSTDWFRNREREMKLLKKAIDEAWKSNLQEEGDDEEMVAQTSLLREEGTEKHAWLPYAIATLPREIGDQEMHLQPVSKLAHWVEIVVQTESPVHFDEVARRLVEAAGITRVGPRIREHLKLAARFAEGAGRIQQKGEFLWWSTIKIPVPRDRGNLPSSSRKLKYIAPEEMEVVIESVVRNAVAIHAEAAFPYIARQLGFNRVTEDMRNEILEQIQQSLVSGKIREEGELLMANKTVVS